MFAPLGGTETKSSMAGHRLGLLAAAITAVIALAAASPASAFVSRESSSVFGVSSPNFYLMNQKGQDALLNSYLSHIQDTGAGWLRDAVPWPDAEPNPRSPAATPTGGTRSTPRSRGSRSTG